MEIKRTNNEILIRLNPKTNLIGLQRITDYIKFREISSKSQASQKDINKLAKESKANWWLKNKSRFTK